MQNNYSVVNQFHANVSFLHPSKTAETLLFFLCVLGVKKENTGLKWVDNSGREIISIRNNATLIYSIMYKIQLRLVLAITTLSTVSLSSFPGNLKVRASDTLNQVLQNLSLITRTR